MLPLLLLLPCLAQAYNDICNSKREWTCPSEENCVYIRHLCDNITKTKYIWESCADGSDEEDCPENCEEDDSLNARVFNCNGKKTCINEPCDGECLNNDDRFCKNKCVSKEEPCDEKCGKDRWYSVYCPEENRCKSKSAPCGDRCLNPDRPLWAPWDDDSHDDGGDCLAAKDCTEDNSFHECNGLCIPILIPCNNTCTTQLVDWQIRGRLKTSKERLYGPLTCSLSIASYFSRSLFLQNEDHRDELSTAVMWTAALHADQLEKVKTMLGHTSQDLGVCLPGVLGCNNTCSIDTERQKRVTGLGRWKKQIFCLLTCNEFWGSRRRYDCDGDCIRNGEMCNGECQEGYGNDNGKCIKLQ